MPSIWAQAGWAAQEPQPDRWLHSAVSPGPMPGAALTLCRGEGRSQVLWFSHAWLCMCMCGYIWSRGGCVPLRPHICRQPICANVCICVHADECVCVCLAACLWVCVMHPHLNFEFAFILVCVLKNMREEAPVPWEVNFLHVPVYDGDTDFLQTPCSSSLLTPEETGEMWVAVEVTSFPRWSWSSEPSFRFLITTSWLQFLSKVEVLKFGWIQMPSENLLTRMDLLFRKMPSKYLISHTMQKAQGALQSLLWISARKQSMKQTLHVLLFHVQCGHLLYGILPLYYYTEPLIER